MTKRKPAEHTLILTDRDAPQLPVSPDAQALEAADASDAIGMFERLARDPEASVDKIAGLMGLWERAEARKAEIAFNAAMSEVQRAVRPVIKNQRNASTKSQYASYDAIDAVVRPIYSGHGFGLSFDTGESPLPEHLRVLCYVTHMAGHSRTYHVDMPADGKGAKGGDVMTRTHAAGSALSYGQRYLLKLIFNIPLKDDDGNKAGKVEEARKSPDGYEAWLEHMNKVAKNGVKALSAAWETSDAAFRKHILVIDWEELKAAARAADKDRADAK